MPTLMTRVAALSRRLNLVSPPPSEPEKFRPDAERDIFLVTYPRSGTTWISCIAAELLFQISPENLTEIDSIIPDVHVLPDKSAVPVARQYLIKSHFPLNGPAPFGEYRRVIYVVRDPRDVLLSYHRFSQFVSKYPGDLTEFAMDWAAGRIWPCSWQEHVNSWLAPRSRPAPFELTVFRYEDFLADPIGQAESLAKVLGVGASRARIEEIVADTSPGSMRRRESKGKNGLGPEFNFIGPARAGSWQELPSGDGRNAISILEEYAHETMQRMGYKSSAEVTD
ncbi:MAG TPA: sulfotransferase domain-containing protein [Methylocella sp.]|nr:sulfotransferase domain-containing protein [Methylocella sp.]